MSFQKTVSKTGHFTLYTSGSLVIMDFAYQSNAEDFREMTAMMKALAAKAGKISSISIAPPKVEKFDDETRAAMKEQQVQTAGMILGTAVVIPVGRCRRWWCAPSSRASTRSRSRRCLPRPSAT